MTPIRTCAHVHNEDIHPEGRANPISLDAAMAEAVTQAIAALGHEAPGYSEFHRNTMASVYYGMLTTHALIQKVLNDRRPNPEAVDALALARLPVEALYTICLMLQDSVWVDRYLSDGWKKQYVRFLLDRAETQNLPRFRDFYTRFGPASLNATRAFHGITDTQVDTIRHDELGTPMPGGTERAPIQRFPTPAGVIERLDNGSAQRNMLERLYYEYVFLCEFVHGLPDALLLKRMFINHHAGDDATLDDTFQRNVVQPAYTTSLISLIQSAAELLTLYPANADLAAAVTNAWNAPVQDILLAKAIWNIRTRELLRTTAVS